MADTLYVRAPDGTVGTIPASEAQAAADAGYVTVSPEEIEGAQAHRVSDVGEQAAVTEGLLQAPADYSVGRAFGEKALSAATFGAAPGLDTAEARARGIRFQEEHPYQAFGAEVAGQLPLAVAGGVAGELAVGGATAAGLGRAAVAGVRAADFGAQALLGGAQTEAEQTRLAGDDFSWTDAAVAGVAGEALGRGAAAGFSAALGTSRNLLARATRTTVADDAASSLARGGMLNDFRVAHHAEAYQNELAALAADDLDRLETAFAEVSRQDRKRARVVRVVEDRPEAQSAVRAEAVAGLAGLREALASELGETPGGPARALLRQLDERATALEAAPSGKRLWRLLDENRQALQDYAQDLHQAYENAPGSAWLSREGLAALDTAEKGTREALLREDVWGREAAEAQAAYNVPFHEKYFPSVKTVRGKLMQTTQLDARGFPVWRGDPGRVRAFFGRASGDVDSARLAEQFTEYLDGVSAIARAGERDAPAAARETLEAVRRLRKATANAGFIQEAVERTARRGRVAETAFEIAGAAGGMAAAGPVGGAVAFGALRGARAGDWLFRAGSRLGWGAGEAESMAKLLGHDALPAAAGRDAPVVDDLLDSAGRGPSEPPPSGAPPAPGGGGAPPGRGVTPSMAADARRGSWQPSDAPGSVRPTRLDLEAPEPTPATLRPDRAERAARDTIPVEGREVHRGAAEALETDPLREAGLAGRREAARLEALTKGEFREVLGRLRSSRAPEASAFADRLEDAQAELTRDGFLTDAPPRLGGPPTRAPGAMDAPPRGDVSAMPDDDRILARKLAGATGGNDGGLYLGADGVRRYVKFYEDPMQAHAEHDAAAVYRLALGDDAAAPKTEVFDLPDGRTAFASEYLDETKYVHKTLDEVTPRDAAKFVDGFWADVLLGNWDVVGTGAGRDFAPNLKWGAAGPVRIDNGGTFAYRALGERKPDGIARRLPELDGFFDPTINPAYAALLEKAGVAEPRELKVQLQHLLQRYDANRLPVDARGPSLDWLYDRKTALQNLLETWETPGERALWEGLGNARKLGARYYNTPKDEIAAIVTAAKQDLTPPATSADDVVLDLGALPPGIEKLRHVSEKTFTALPEAEQKAVNDWVGSSSGLREQANIGLNKSNFTNPDPAAFSRALDALTVMTPTKHGPLFRFVDLPDEAIAELLSREDFVAGAPMSSAYQPDPNFGGVELRFEHVDSAASLLGANISEYEMLLLPEARFQKTGQHFNPDTGRFTFIFREVPETSASPGFGNVGILALPVAAGAAAASEDGGPAQAGVGPGGAFAATAGLLRQGRGRLVATVARRLFASAAEPALRVTARLAYSRAQLDARREEFTTWQQDPQQLVARVAEGLRDAPPDAFSKSATGVFAAATFLRGKLPQTGPASPIGLRGVPVSAEAASKYARYEQAALRPGDALRESSESGYMSPELLETLQELYPDLLAEVRVAAIQTVRESAPGGRLSIQAKTQYARLFDGDGSLADPAFSTTAVAMANLAFEQSSPAPKPPTTGGSPNVSRQATAVAAPQPWRTG